MRIFVLMVVGVLAVSTSAPLIAAMTVPALAISFWRNGLATAALAPVVASRHRAELRDAGRRQLRLVGLAGVALAVHFGTWVSSVKLTSVASSTAIVCLQIAWVVTWQLLRGERFPRGVVVGLLLAFLGVLIVSGVDFTVSLRALTGDLLALVGGIAGAAYIVVGARVRQTMTTTAYTFVCYGTCAVLLAVACVVAGQPLGGYPAHQWGLLVLATVTAQLLGHSVFNHLLATTTPMLVSLALLLEVPGAALLAGIFLGQRPPPGVLVGLVVILGGMALVVVNNRRTVPVDLTAG